jgi:inward rectifier potassium channel
MPRKRLIKTLRSLQVRQERSFWQPAELDFYHWLLALRWRVFLLVISLFYFVLNLGFALLYLWTGGIANAKPGSFKDAFFFSIQTLSTVGYGSMYPQSLSAQILMAFEVWIGLLSIAILTGLMFARFSRPTARVLFSRVAVVCPLEGVPTLMFRAANRRDNRILEAQVQVNLLRNEVTAEGHQLRRFYDLNLLRSRTPIFGLSWLIMHPMDGDSPLCKVSWEELRSQEAELWITLTGLDETFSQTIHSRYAYTMADILWGRRFVDIFSRSPEGLTYIDLTYFHEVEPIDAKRLPTGFERSP